MLCRVADLVTLACPPPGRHHPQSEAKVAPHQQAPSQPAQPGVTPQSHQPGGGGADGGGRDTLGQSGREEEEIRNKTFKMPSRLAEYPPQQYPPQQKLRCFHVFWALNLAVRFGEHRNMLTVVDRLWSFHSDGSNQPWSTLGWNIAMAIEVRIRRPWQISLTILH